MSRAKAWDVFIPTISDDQYMVTGLNRIATHLIYDDDASDDEQVKRFLVEHYGYSPSIVVRKVK